MIRCLTLLAASFCIGVLTDGASAAAVKRPNVLLILSDDQGWGDFGFHGNPHLKTPCLDRLASESTELSQFYVSPVCSPTRGQPVDGPLQLSHRRDRHLSRPIDHGHRGSHAGRNALRGRLSHRHLWQMALGRQLSVATHRPGLLESLVHRGGGIGQPADPPGNRYFDPTLSHNGVEQQTHGYCSDIFTDAAIQFIEDHDAANLFLPTWRSIVPTRRWKCRPHITSGTRTCRSMMTLPGFMA